MFDISQATSMLQSLGTSSSVANKTAERSVQNTGTDGQSFFEALQQNLAALATASNKTNGAKPNRLPDQTASNSTTKAEDTSILEPMPPITAPFENFQEFKNWEKGLGNTFAETYKAPDYIRVMGLSLWASDEGAFQRYLFFKNNPQYAVDYESIRNGNLSKYPSDGSTLVKTDLSTMDASTANYYRKNVGTLLLAEGFSMDPTLLKKRMDGNLEGIGDPDWLSNHRWVADRAEASNNRVAYAQAAFIGVDGKGAGNYRLAKYDSATGRIIDVDGRSYDPITGEEELLSRPVRS
jgi:hypothetical protein